MAGITDFLNTPQGMGLLSGIASYAMNARRGTPVNNIGRGVAGGLLGYQGAQDSIKQDKDKEFANQYRQMQIDEIKRKQAEQQAAQQWKQGLPGVMDQAQTKVTPFEADNPFGEDLGAMANVRPGNPQALQDYMMRPESPYADKLIERQLFPKSPDYKTVGDSLVEIGSEGVKPVYTANPKDKRPWYVSQDEQGRTVYDPVYMEAEKTLGPIRAPKVEVNQRTENVTKQQSKQSEVYGGGLGELRAEAQKTAFQAPVKMARLDRMETLLKGVDSGSLSGAGLEAARLAKSFGFDIDPKLGNKQAAEALAIEMALAMREPGSGPMTDKDFDNYLNTVPSLAKTAQGRMEITATLRAKLRRDIEIARMMRDYAKNNDGVIDDNFLDQAANYMAANPIVPGARDYGSGWGKLEKVK